MHERVRAYIDTLAPEQAHLVGELRRLVLEAAPEASESWKWSQAVYEQGGPLCWIKAHPAHVTLGFWRGLQLPSAPGAIEGSGAKMGHLKIASKAELKVARVKRLVREAVALNAERGDPTRNP